MILNFKEIPKANSSEGLQDTFELFARDFLECIGYQILIDPCRGSDGKKDLIILENRIGVGGTSKIKWLVSCKHYAHSGKSVIDTNEPDIFDRVQKHKCNGFIGLYSTLASTSLSSKLEGLKDKIEYSLFDREKIEKKLLENVQGKELASRFFPKSLENHFHNNPAPSKVFIKNPIIKCENCGIDLVKKGNGIWVGLEKIKKSNETRDGFTTDNAYFSCKGKCDFILREVYRRKKFDNRGWLNIDDFKNPLGFLSELMKYIDRTEYYNYNNEANKKMKILLKATYPYIARQITEKEKLKAFFFDLQED
jgi:hypothetical protein